MTKENYWSLKKQIFESDLSYEEKIEKFRAIVQEAYDNGDIISVSQFASNLNEDSRSFHHAYIMSGRIDVIWVDSEIGYRKNIKNVFLCKDETIRSNRIDLDYETNEIIFKDTKDPERLPAQYAELWNEFGITIDRKKFENVSLEESKSIYEHYKTIKPIQVTTTNKYAENQCMLIKIDIEKLVSTKAKVSSVMKEVFPLNILSEIDNRASDIDSSTAFDTRKFLELFYSGEIIDDREREILERLYRHNETASSIADLMNLSATRISQIKSETINKFRKDDALSLFTLDLEKQSLIESMSSEIESLRKSLDACKSVEASIQNVDNLQLNLVLSNQRLRRVLEELNLFTVKDLTTYIRDRGLSSISEYPSIGNKAYQSLIEDFKNSIGLDLELYERTRS